MTPQQASMASDSAVSTGATPVGSENSPPMPDQGQPQQQQPRSLNAEPQQASPEEQGLYNKFVSKAFILVYDKKFFPAVLKMLEGGGSPEEGLAIASSKVIARVLQTAEAAGEKLPGDVIFHGAKEIFEDLAELSRRAGIKDYSQDHDALEGAYFQALDQFRMILQQTGGINKEAAQADLAMLEKMDKDGELQSMFQNMAARDEASQSNAPSDAENPVDAASEPNGEPAQEQMTQPPKRGLMQGGAR